MDNERTQQHGDTQKGGNAEANRPGGGEGNQGGNIQEQVRNLATRAQREGVTYDQFCKMGGEAWHGGGATGQPGQQSGR